MFTLILRRLGLGLFLVFVVVTITFFLTHAANLPVARSILGPTATARQIAVENRVLGLNLPVYQQYVDWVWNALHGNLGTSYLTGDSVSTDLVNRLPITMSVVFIASGLTIVFSLLLGLGSATRAGLVDRILQAISTLAHVFPTLILAIAFVFLFAITLKFVPATGFVTFSDSPAGWFASVILPSVILSIGGIAALASQIRGSMLDELNKDYIRTLRSRGFSERSIVLKHVLRNASGPALTTFSLQFIGMFGASLFIERIFALPGFGTYAYTSSLAGDLPSMLGVTLFSVALVVIVNLAVDIANGLLNPKARQS